ncbi:MAG: thiol-disulfide oxidoreductase DCC family protein [Henriciella sp.]|jgi:predicted DCC family thiol-disulfide oxidoreductase YuxK
MTLPFTIFYDGSCPLCRREIGFYQKQIGADQLTWQDVSRIRSGDVVEGLSCETAMARFHIRTEQGDLVQGGLAFALLWQKLPRFRWLGLIAAARPLRWALQGGYRLFLPLRPLLQKLVR